MTTLETQQQLEPLAAEDLSAEDRFKFSHIGQLGINASPPVLCPMQIALNGLEVPIVAVLNTLNARMEISKTEVLVDPAAIATAFLLKRDRLNTERWVEYCAQQAYQGRGKAHQANELVVDVRAGQIIEQEQVPPTGLSQ